MENYIIRIKKGQLTESYIHIPTGQLFSFNYNGTEYWHNTINLETPIHPEAWNRSMMFMFPIISTAENNIVDLNGKEYPMGSHGISRELSWKVISSGNDYIILVQDYDGSVIKNSRQGKLSAEIQHAPHRLTQEISINSNGVTIDTILKNTSGEIIKYNLGMHPALKVIVDPNAISLESNTEQKETSLNKLVNASRATSYEGATEMTYRHEKGILTMHTRGFKDMILWTKHNHLNDATMLCIEPVTNIPDRKNRKYWSKNQKCEVLRQGQDRGYHMDIQVAQFR